MSDRPPLVFKIATEDWELELVHQLNYKTFVEEIPQHNKGLIPRLVDKFHAENTYLICLCGRTLVGMLAARSKRPFSLDQKVTNLDSFLPPNRSLCEVRLLAVDKKFRTGQVFQGLMALMWQHFVENGYDMGIISGTTRQLKLYQHLGFVPFGPLVGSEGAQFQPMYLSIESFEAGAREFLRAAPAKGYQRSVVNFLPGPVAIRREVQRAFERAAESHRASEFIKDFAGVKTTLCGLTGARQAELMMGSGTLANDVVAAQISLLKKPGLMLSNGEFGERLINHADRFGLKFEILKFNWGQPIDIEAVKKALEGLPEVGWIWCAHCETSTSQLNDLNALKAICAERNLKLCLDCISSIGNAPVNLEGVYLASCASGKGLRSYPGLGMVFYNHDLKVAKRLPRYLDLGYYAKQGGIPFTFSSNLLYALKAAIERVDWPKRFCDTVEHSKWLRGQLTALGFDIIGSEIESSPAVITIVLPGGMSSTVIGDAMQEAGFLMSYNSQYLREKNWMQICLMGDYSHEKLVSLINQLNRVCFRKTGSKSAEAIAKK